MRQRKSARSVWPSGRSGNKSELSARSSSRGKQRSGRGSTRSGRSCVGGKSITGGLRRKSVRRPHRPPGEKTVRGGGGGPCRVLVLPLLVAHGRQETIGRGRLSAVPGRPTRGRGRLFVDADRLRTLGRRPADVRGPTPVLSLRRVAVDHRPTVLRRDGHSRPARLDVGCARPSRRLDAPGRLYPRLGALVHLTPLPGGDPATARLRSGPERTRLIAKVEARAGASVA